MAENTLSPDTSPLAFAIRRSFFRSNWSCLPGGRLEPGVGLVRGGGAERDPVRPAVPRERAVARQVAAMHVKQELVDSALSDAGEHRLRSNHVVVAGERAHPLLPAVSNVLPPTSSTWRSSCSRRRASALSR